MLPEPAPHIYTHILTSNEAGAPYQITGAGTKQDSRKYLCEARTYDSGERGFWEAKHNVREDQVPEAFD